MSKFTTSKIQSKKERFLAKIKPVHWKNFKKINSYTLKHWLLLITLGLPIISVLLFIIIIIVYSIGLPNVRNLDQYKVSESTFIYDRNGVELYTIHGNENRESITIFDRDNIAFQKDECSKLDDKCALADGYKNIILATIAIEDDRFYSHHGFDPERLGKAVLSQFLPNIKARGGSTITQQYIKNSLLSSEQKISRKIKELILSVKIENVFNKEEILELYLNHIPYGSNAYGIELAAKTYFNKSAKDLSLAEAAILAALPNAPSRYSPYGNYRYADIYKKFTKKELKKRNITSEADLNYDEFVRGLLGTVIKIESIENFESSTATNDKELTEKTTNDEFTEKETTNNKSENHKINERATPNNTELGNNVIYIKGRTDLILNRMEELGYITKEEKQAALEESWTKEFTRSRQNILAPHFVMHIKQVLESKYGREVIEQGGLKVYTTLDYKLQKAAEEALTAKKEFNTTNYGTKNAALISMDVKTGDVLAMLGSNDYFDEEIDGNVNMTLSYLQPGSTFKPFVFALAFQKGILQPGSILYDVKTSFGHSHMVSNYDGSFMGPLSVRQALARSRNITAIKAYFLAGSQEEILPFTEGLGVEFLDPKIENGSSLALGSAEVNLLSLVEGYMTIANYGVKKEPRIILKIENNDGEILEEVEKEKLKEQKEGVTFGGVDDKSMSEEELKTFTGSSEENQTNSTKENAENNSENNEEETIHNLDELTPTPLEDLKENNIMMDPQAAYLITSILSDTSERFGSNLSIPGWQNAAKTGTSNKRLENNKILPNNTLTIGYTTEIVTGVWAGNSDNSVLSWNATGYNTAAPMWRDYMIKAHEGRTPSNFPVPVGITRMSISSVSGLLPNKEKTPKDKIRSDLFASYAIPTKVENTFQEIDIDKITKKLWTKNCPLDNKIHKSIILHKTLFTQYPLWQAGINAWAKQDGTAIPTETCDADYKRDYDIDPTIQIISPFDKGQVPLEPFKVYANISSPNGISKVEYYLGDIMQYQTKTPPYIGNLRPGISAKHNGKSTIKIKAYDTYEFSTIKTIDIRFDKNLSEINEPNEFEEEPTEEGVSTESKKETTPNTTIKEVVIPAVEEGAVEGEEVNGVEINGATVNNENNIETSENESSKDDIPSNINTAIPPTTQP